MHLMSCEHPQRIFNKYLNEYIWVPCGKCNSCKNRRAKKWTDACERERSVSKFTLFVTLTYDECSLPLYNYTGGFDELDKSVYSNVKYLYSTRLHDVECMELSNDLFDEDADRNLFNYFLDNKGIPYASKSDIQLFHKRLNKWFYQNVTNKYKNFRYFIVSELGSTTLRPHFHALYFVNDNEIARCFQDGILACWKFGRIDCQYVENSACSYVAQYINKFFDLPSFYKASQIRPFFLCSRNPIIGAVGESPQSDEEIFNNAVVQTLSYSRKDSKYVLTELYKACEDRIFPKCPSYGKISNYVRVELYAISERFKSRSFQGFRQRISAYLNKVYDKYDDDYLQLIKLVAPHGYGARGVSEFTELLRNFVDGFSEKGVNWLRRLYYLSRKVLRNAERFKVSLFAYVQKIDEYWNKKQLYLINKMYEFQQNYMEDTFNDCSVDDLLLMYPEFAWSHGFTYGDLLSQFTPKDVKCQRDDAAYYAFTNKRVHLKNMYLESLREVNNNFYKQLKNFYHAKKCNEISEALATSCAK